MVQQLQPHQATKGSRLLCAGLRVDVGLSMLAVGGGWYNLAVNVIVKDRDILGGTPVFRGTRVPVRTLFDYPEGG
jgi:hypothetical protein